MPFSNSKVDSWRHTGTLESRINSLDMMVFAFPIPTDVENTSGLIQVTLLLAVSQQKTTVCIFKKMLI